MKIFFKVFAYNIESANLKLCFTMIFICCHLKIFNSFFFILFIGDSIHLTFQITISYIIDSINLSFISSQLIIINCFFYILSYSSSFMVHYTHFKNSFNNFLFGCFFVPIYSLSSVLRNKSFVPVIKKSSVLILSFSMS
jgi:hypothetical protein